MRITQKPARAISNGGFTLIELLIVIAIIAVLSIIGFSVASRSMKSARQTESMGNMRQIAQIINGHAMENGGRMMPVKHRADNGYGVMGDIHWHQEIIKQTNTAKAYSGYLGDKDWWRANEPLVLNPLFKSDPSWEAWNPGYAINNYIHENMEAVRKTREGMSWEKRFWGYMPPLSAIPDPARTPLIIQSVNYHMGGFLTGTRLASDARLDNFLIEGKMNVTFVDGHSELLRFADADGKRLPVCEYSKRGLDKMPKF